MQIQCNTSTRWPAKSDQSCLMNVSPYTFRLRFRTPIYSLLKYSKPNDLLYFLVAACLLTAHALVNNGLFTLQYPRFRHSHVITDNSSPQFVGSKPRRRFRRRKLGYFVIANLPIQDEATYIENSGSCIFWKERDHPQQARPDHMALQTLQGKTCRIVLKLVAQLTSTNTLNPTAVSVY